MTVDQLDDSGRRLAPSGLEAGTAPDDRRFRPDVEGLRAIAILLVVLYHAGLPGVTGGYVGVDVFFVISGFVITGLLLRERQGTGRTSIIDFYARRSRRILPAATLVIFAAVLATYFTVNAATGNSAADDGRWAAAFLSNFHFASVGTNYFTSTLPPSPLQNYWSLSVEEQFYVVFPTLFLLVARVKGVGSHRTRMAAVLVVIIGLSYGLSITQTSSAPLTAYFSLFTRAWELALGALISIGTPWLLTVPRYIGRWVTWSGLAAVLAADLTFTASTPYPGSLVAVPVIGAGMIIAGGVTAAPRSAEWLLGLPPFQWVGRRSYSWYLWHWPILIVAAEASKLHALPVGENLVLVLVALGLSAVTYAAVENPVRRWRLPSRISVIGGMTVVVATVLAMTLLIATQTGQSRYPVTPAPTATVVASTVARSLYVADVPNHVVPPLSRATTDWGGAYESHSCIPGITESTTAICVLGDTHSTHLLVVYGDSHALMWLPAFEEIASDAHWKLVVLAKPGCPAASLTIVNPSGLGPIGGPFVSCDQWHTWAVDWINQHHPAMLVLTQVGGHLAPTPGGGPPRSFTAAQWQRGVATTLSAVTSSGTEKVVLGETPALPEAPVPCLRRNPDRLQACSIPDHTATPTAYVDGEEAAARQTGSRYINPLPWFCSATCPAVVGKYVVYMDDNHVTATYARYLERVLGRSLALNSVRH